MGDNVINLPARAGDPAPPRWTWGRPCVPANAYLPAHVRAEREWARGWVREHLSHGGSPFDIAEQAARCLALVLRTHGMVDVGFLYAHTLAHRLWQYQTRDSRLRPSTPYL
jgi:hypothetical protein